MKKILFLLTVILLTCITSCKSNNPTQTTDKSGSLFFKANGTTYSYSDTPVSYKTSTNVTTVHGGSNGSLTVSVELQGNTTGTFTSINNNVYGGMGFIYPDDGLSYDATAYNLTVSTYESSGNKRIKGTFTATLKNSYTGNTLSITEGTFDVYNQPADGVNVQN